MPRFAFAVALAWASTIASPAVAHFLLVRIRPPAEGGRAAEVYFSELAEAGDPRYIDKVAGAKFFLQTTPGDFRPLEMRKLSDRLRAHVPSDESLMVAGHLDYGVLARPGQTPFLLRHYSKAVSGKPAEVNRLLPRESPLEIVATFENDRVLLKALLNAKPMPGTIFTTVDTNLTNQELKADDQGVATFTPDAPGMFSIYIKHVDPTPGEHNGQSYKEIRAFATLAFAWPLAPTGADPEAVKLFEDALATRASWKNFPGFTAKISGDVEDRPFTGNVTVAGDGSVEVAIDEDAMQPWVQEQLESITMHRASQDGPKDSHPVLRFADDHDDHPLGRLLAFEGGHFASSYRVRGGQISVVNRLIVGKDMTITVLENQKNVDGLYLPHNYTVQYWDDATGKLESTQTVQDRWIRAGNWDLPSRRTVTTSSDSGFSVRSFKLEDHKLSGRTSK